MENSDRCVRQIMIEENEVSASGEKQSQNTLAAVISQLSPEEIVQTSGTSATVERVRAYLSKLIEDVRKAEEIITKGIARTDAIDIVHATGRSRTEIVRMIAERLGDTGYYESKLVKLYPDMHTQKVEQIAEYRLLKGEPINDPKGNKWVPDVEVFTNLRELPIKTPGNLEPGQHVEKIVLRRIPTLTAPNV